MPPLTPNVALAPLTTLRVGGSADLYAVATTEAEVVAIATYANQYTLPLRVLAGGSNVFVPDEGVSGVVLHMQCRGVSYEEFGDTVLVTAAAGTELDELVAETVDRGYWGLENLSHIPGSVGATPIQNVGAYGVETSDVLQSVRAYDQEQGMFVELDTAACCFGYRDSIFKQEPGRYIVTAVTYALSRTPCPQLQYQGLQAVGLTEQSPLAAIRAAVIQVRAGKFPDWHTVGTAGSFFKNPIIEAERVQRLQATYPELPLYPAAPGTVKVSLGYILDKVCGLRGHRQGAVELYKKQALVLVAQTGATAAEVDAFADWVAAEVDARVGISIEREVTRLG